MAVEYHKEKGVAYVTISNPKKANILDRSTSNEISEIWKDAWEDLDVKSIILTGDGDKYFCAGHSLELPEGVTPDDNERIRTESIFWPLSGTVNGAKIGADGRLGDHYPQIWKPVIGAINGWAVGAGFYLMLASTDIRIASHENARFKFALLSQGWVGGGPGATYLTRQISHADAMKILLTDEPFNAEEALRINLVNEIVPHGELIKRAEEIAHGITKIPPLAVRMMKEFVTRFGDIPVTEAWRVQTLMNTLLTQLSTDGIEGRQAFLEKRPPEFTGGMMQKGEPFPDLSEDQRKRLEDIKRELHG